MTCPSRFVITRATKAGFVWSDYESIDFLWRNNCQYANLPKNISNIFNFCLKSHDPVMIDIPRPQTPRDNSNTSWSSASKCCHCLNSVVKVEVVLISMEWIKRLGCHTSQLACSSMLCNPVICNRNGIDKRQNYSDENFWNNGNIPHISLCVLYVSWRKRGREEIRNK